MEHVFTKVLVVSQRRAEFVWSDLMIMVMTSDLRSKGYATPTVVFAAVTNHVSLTSSRQKCHISNGSLGSAILMHPITVEC